jgi:hypothetical protein
LYTATPERLNGIILKFKIINYPIPFREQYTHIENPEMPEERFLPFVTITQKTSHNRTFE